VASHSPIVIVIGGPNGAGKSTIAPAIIARAFGGAEFVNADTIARGLSELDPERQAFAAGRIMLRHIGDLAAAHRDFAFETTLASRTFAPSLRRLIRDGYRVHITYVSLLSPDLAVKRVHLRVRAGGHNIPEATIRRRFGRSVSNLFDLYLPLAATWEILDNSSPSGLVTVASGGIGMDTIVYSARHWNRLERSRHDWKT
jgi:predicted ABC-type ATPase